jgi:hypothetical protein
MPYTMDFTKDGKGVLRKGLGVLKGQEIIEGGLALLAEERRLRGLTYGRADFTEVTSIEITPDDIHRIADTNKRMAKLNPNVVVVVIAPGDAMFGMSRMWETLAETTGWKTKVVRTAAEADAWLEAELALRRQ